MELRKKLLSVAALAFAATLSAGIAVSAGATSEPQTNADFKISGVSVRLDDSERDDDGSGIRFKVDVPEAWTKDAVTDAYTMVTLTPQSGAFEGVQKSAKVSAQVWRDATGWNTVLVNIPEADYTTAVTAQAYVEIGDDVYVTKAETYSIAQAAALAMNAGKATEAQVGHYVAGKVDSITLNETAVTLTDDETVTLTATVAPTDYAVVWSSDNTAVATVDANGKVTAVGHGTANITASIGGVSATCVVTAKQHLITDFSDKAIPTDSNGVPFVRPVYDRSTAAESNAWKDAGAYGTGITCSYWQRSAWVGTTGETGAADDFGLYLQFQNRSNSFALFGYTVSYLDEIFADANVGAITWKMRVKQNSSTIKMQSNVAAITTAWQASFTTSTEFQTMTITREMWQAAKDAGKTLIEVNFSPTTGNANWGANLEIYQDNFKRVFNNEIEQPKVPLITDFSDKAIPTDSQGVPFVRPVYDRSTATESNAWKDAGAYGTGVTCSYWQRSAWVGTTGETGAADDFGLFFQFANRSNSFALFGYSVSYLDEIFADNRVTAITWKMRVKQNASTIKIQSNVAAITTAWQASFTTSTEFQTMTLTREMWQAAKDAGKTLIEVNFSPVGQTSWGVNLEIYQDNFMRVYED